MNDYPPQQDMGNRALNEFLKSIISSTAQADIDLIALMNQCATFSADDLERMELYEKLVAPLNTRWKAHRDELALIAYLEVATELLGLYLPGHPDRGTWCYDYDRALESNFPCLEDDGLLDEAIRLGREALALRPAGHPDRAPICALFANLLAKYVEENKDEAEESEDEAEEGEDEAEEGEDEAEEGEDEAEENEDVALLREVIQLDREVVSLRPIGHPNRDEALRDLAASLTSLYHETEDVSLLEEVISLEREVVDLQPSGHPRHTASCASLSASLEALHDETEDISLVHEMIPLDREVMSLLPADHDMRSNTYGNLASSLYLLYKDTNDEAVLDEVIQLERDALALRPAGHSRRGSACENLSTSLGIRFELTGDPTIIGEATHLHRELLALRPPDHPERASTCGDTAFWLMERFFQTGDPTVLTEALHLAREALAIASPDDPGRASACDTVARVLEELYGVQDTEDKTLLQEAIRLRREVLALHPSDHPDYAYTCLNLAAALGTWSDDTDDPAAMSEAVQLERQAVASLDARHPNRGWACTNLANSLINTFEANEESYDQALLDEASKLLDEALLLYPSKHAYHWKTLQQCVRLAVARENYTLAIQLLDEAFDTSTSNIIEFLDFIIEAIESIDDSELSRSEEKALLRLHESAINRVIFATGFAVDHSAQLQRLVSGSAFGSSAFMLSTRVEELPLGLQLLERARGIIWAETLHMRNPQLVRVPEALAKKLEVLIQYSTANGPHLQKKPVPAVRDQPFLPERDRLYEQRSQLQLTLQEIRSLPGLDSFMREPTSETLQTVADHNVVVVLIEDEGTCHALIIRSSRAPLVHLPLEDIGEEGLQELTFAHSSFQQRGARDNIDDLDGQRLAMKRSQRLSAARVVLAKLWRTIVKPIITHLGLVKSQGRDRPRIHWCPTGTFAFAPVHAAGIYDGSDQECCADYVVSSYTPTLTALLHAQQGAEAYTPDNLKLLLIAAERSHDRSLPTLCFVPQEMRTIREAASVANVSAQTAEKEITPAKLVASLEAANFVHLACHGIQHSSEPHKSEFSLSSGSLTVSQLMAIDLKDAFFAFLSACETAKGDQEHADEVVHLAATMLFAGFKSIVATMWAMNDQDGPFIAKRFYEKVFESEAIDVDTIAYALDHAVSELRGSGAPPERWATFIHMGA